VLKNARKEYHDRMLEQIANVYSRLNTVANRLGINLQDALWHKFPGACPYCLRPKNCQCLLNHPREISASDPKLTRLRKMVEKTPTRLRDHQFLQHKIYFNQNQLFDLRNLSSRLVEETCELSEACRGGDQEAILGEAADVASFIFAICNLMNKNRKNHECIYIDQLVLAHYPWQCKKCHRNVCCGTCSK
jgi:NTP pyrophosphatase (non-canonical NTP hydrolase)